MGNIITIGKRELSAYFASPVAYVFIVIFLLLSNGLTFILGGFFEMNEASLNFSFFRWHPWIYLFLVPAVGMRLWSEERRQGTIELLMTMPITPWQAIVGKFMASWIFIGIALALTFPVVLTVNHLGMPDNGVIIGAYIGSMLLAGAYLAITCLTSAFTRNQVIAFIVSVVICFGLVLAGIDPVVEFCGSLAQWFGAFVAGISVMTHFQDLQRGVIDSRDLIYFVSIIGFSLFSTGVVLKSIRS